MENDEVDLDELLLDNKPEIGGIQKYQIQGSSAEPNLYPMSEDKNSEESFVRQHQVGADELKDIVESIEKNENLQIEILEPNNRSSNTFLRRTESDFQWIPPDIYDMNDDKDDEQDPFQIIDHHLQSLVKNNP